LHSFPQASAAAAINDLQSDSVPSFSSVMMIAQAAMAGIAAASAIGMSKTSGMYTRKASSATNCTDQIPRPRTRAPAMNQAQSRRAGAAMSRSRTWNVAQAQVKPMM